MLNGLLIQDGRIYFSIQEIVFMRSSEVIVLSSDDEDDDWLVSKSHKRSKILDADSDVTVIEKMPGLEAKTIEKHSLDCLIEAEAKRPQDDDCCILNYDPENNVHVPDFQANDADDLVVVGERGPVACRDFPHARHLCVKFPYSTTSHEKHCEQCHCYVCDVVAPCVHWGQGRQRNDHCHAFDKDDKWRRMRSQARSRLTTAQPAPIQWEQATQPQRKTYTHPPLWGNFTTTGLKGGSTYSANVNASLPSLNQGTPNMSGLPPNLQPYLPSNRDTIPANGLLCNLQPYLPSNRDTTPANGAYGNSVAFQGANVFSVGNHYSTSNATACRGRVFNEHRSPGMNIATSTMTSPASQQGGHHLRSTSNHEFFRNTQTGTHRQGTMPQSSSIVASQAGTHLPNSTSLPIQHYQDQRAALFSAYSYNYSEHLAGTTQRISLRPPPLPLSNFNKNLATLQSYLMEGISGERQSQSSAHEPIMKDAGCVQSSGNSMLQGPSQMARNAEMGPLYNPFEPSEVLAFDNAGANLVASQAENTEASEQINEDVGNLPLDGALNKNTEQPLNMGAGTDTSSLLDHILAGFDDDDLWTLLEPRYLGL